MNAEEILMERIKHEIDMDILKQIGEEVKIDLSKEINLAEKRFNCKLDRVLNGITNKSAHEKNNL
jgi:hypothetical protein